MSQGENCYEVFEQSWNFSDVGLHISPLPGKKGGNVPLVINITDGCLISSFKDTEIHILCRIPSVVFYTDVSTCYYGELPADVDEQSAIKVENIPSLVMSKSTVALHFGERKQLVPAYVLLAGLLQRLVSVSSSHVGASDCIVTAAFPDYDVYRILLAITKSAGVHVRRILHENSAYFLSTGSKLSDDKDTPMVFVNATNSGFLTSGGSSGDRVFEVFFHRLTKDIQERNFDYIEYVDDKPQSMNLAKKAEQVFLANFALSQGIVDGFKLLCPNASIETLDEHSLLVGSHIQLSVLNGDVKDVILLDVCPSSFEVRTKNAMLKFFPQNRTIPTKKSIKFDTPDGSVDLLLDGSIVLRHFELPSAGKYELSVDIDANGVIRTTVTDDRTGKQIVCEQV